MGARSPTTPLSVLALCATMVYAAAVAAVTFGVLSTAGPSESVPEAAAGMLILAGGCVLAWTARASRRENFVPMQRLLLMTAILILVFIAVGAEAGDVTMRTVSFVAGGVFLALFAAMSIVFSRVVRSLFGLRFFAAGQALTFRSLAGAFIEGGKLERLTAEDLLVDCDSYLQQVVSARKGQIALGLVALEAAPILFLKPPLSWMSREQCVRFIRKHFMESGGMVRDLVRGMYQLSYMAYYGDPRTFSITGFVPFEERERFAEMPRKPDPPPLKVHVPRGVTSDRETDFCVIGSGAAGSVVAHHLARSTGRKVLVVEKGSYLIPQRDFTNLEPGMIAALYVDGGLQLTQDFDLSILQGSCVGGSTVVNNGICFRIPQAVLQTWASLGASIDSDRLSRAYEEVEDAIGARPLPPGLANRGAARLMEGARQLAMKGDWFTTNFGECGGSGYCNIGCKYNRKLSMLLNYLPMAVDCGAEIVAGTEALKFEFDAGRAVALMCRSAEGNLFRVRAKAFAVSCGTIASSILLLNSGMKRNVGTRVSFNVASPMHAEFPDPLNAFDGVQMCCYVGRDGLLIENTFNPPAATSLIMSGWFEEHYRRMQRYRYLATAAPVVGSKANGRIAKSFLGGLGVEYTIDPEDFAALKKGLGLLCSMFFAAGSLRVYPSTFAGTAIERREDIGTILASIGKPEDLSMTSAHPQGGNPMSDDPAIGAVGSDFRVYGCDNLFVCDASVFPASIGVNPQLTIMALARCAADTIAAAG